MTYKIPTLFANWFTTRGWQLRDYQREMVEAFKAQRSTLLIAPTGGGKTLSGFLPSLIDLHEQPQQGMHTLYISPLKALTNDIQRNLMQPIEEMGLDITVESRTGDTPSHKRQRQRKKPPNIFLTTPESLMLMLSYIDAPKIFGNLKSVIIDEAHSLAPNKRGDFTTLALARLQKLAPKMVRFGLSATVADPEGLAAWLAPTKAPASLLQSALPMQPHLAMLRSDQRMPYGGYMAKYAAEDIYTTIKEAGTSLVFVNTRAQAELVFQHIWDVNVDALPIAVYHGSLSKEQRRRTEEMMARGELRSVVATSALELGIDWGDVDLVIQIGAPKGVSRLLQRIGRSNHRLDEPSRAVLVPANRFEALECQTAMDAISEDKRDGDPLLAGSLDMVPQFIMNCACSAPIDADNMFNEIRMAQPFSQLDRPTFEALLQFTIDGGYALRNYERYTRLEFDADSMTYSPANRRVTQRHRMNIGVIVEAGRLKVKRLRKAHSGKILGEVEEYFAQGLTKGDTFLFAGEVLAFEGVEDMILEAWPAKGGKPKIPSYVGGQMPLSTFLAEGVRDLLDAERFDALPADVTDWLDLQQQFSVLPRKGRLLVEHFPHHEAHYTLFYTFEGRKANQTLGMLLTRRMEQQNLKPISFSVTDYGLSIASLAQITGDDVAQLFSQDILGDDLEEWIADSPMLRRSFRRVATISGLTEQQNVGTRKTMKQVTFSTDLIYDVLRKYEPNHILLRVTRDDAERELLDIQRLGELLRTYENAIDFVALDRVSPLAIPIVLGVRSEQVRGTGMEALLEEISMQEQAELMMQEVRDAVAAQ